MNIFFLACILFTTRSQPGYAGHDEYFHDEICELMHSRPFWIDEADTCGPFGVWYVRYVNPKYRPFFSLQTVSGWSEHGVAVYSPEMEDTFGTGAGYLAIAWEMIDKESIEKSLEEQFLESYESLKVDTSYTSTFKGNPAQVYAWEDTSRVLHYSNVFFEAGGFDFEISTSCNTGPKFAHPGSLWWSWLEEHWYWAEEKNTAWDRYPVVTPDSLWGWSDEQG